MGKMNPQQMQKLMKQFGIKTEEIPAKKVIIELEGKELVIENPSVTAMIMQGKKTYTVMGDEKEEEQGFPEEDIEMVMEQGKCDRERAEKVLKELNGDIAEAIIKLKQEKELKK